MAHLAFVSSVDRHAGGLGLLAINFVWEVIRQNVSEPARSDWPLRLTLIDIPSSANLIAVLGGLMLARAQFSRTVRPWFGHSWTPRTAHLMTGSCTSSMVARAMHRITSVRYRIRFHSDLPDATPPWQDYQQFTETLTVRRIGTADLEAHWIGIVPLVPQQRSTDGLRLAAFSYRGLALIDHLDILIHAKDSVGDWHELRLRSDVRLPNRAVEGRTSARTDATRTGSHEPAPAATPMSATQVRIEAPWRGDGPGQPLKRLARLLSASTTLD